uniref:Uncharacterized protein n=1 Tax=Panagrolaimus sp. JU765 TaxID=591449 RepID=A0AC34QJC5_9BILA
MFAWLEKVSLLGIPERPVILEPIDRQILKHSEACCRRATAVSAGILLWSIFSVPVVLFSSCKVARGPFNNVERFLVFNSVALCILTLVSINAGRQRNKHLYLPILVHLTAVCMFSLVVIIVGPENLWLESAIFGPSGVFNLFILLQINAGFVWIYWSAFQSIWKYEKYIKTGLIA